MVFMYGSSLYFVLGWIRSHTSCVVVVVVVVVVAAA